MDDDVTIEGATEVKRRQGSRPKYELTERRGIGKEEKGVEWSGRIVRITGK